MLKLLVERAFSFNATYFHLLTFPSPLHSLLSPSPSPSQKCFCEPILHSAGLITQYFNQLKVCCSFDSSTPLCFRFSSSWVRVRLGLNQLNLAHLAAPITECFFFLLSSLQRYINDEHVLEFLRVVACQNGNTGLRAESVSLQVLCTSLAELSTDTAQHGTHAGGLLRFSLKFTLRTLIQCFLVIQPMLKITVGHRTIVR